MIAHLVDRLFETVFNTQKHASATAESCKQYLTVEIEHKRRMQIVLRFGFEYETDPVHLSYDVLLELSSAQHRHETEIAKGFYYRFALSLEKTLHLLMLIAYGYDHITAHLELVDQGLGNIGSSARNDDTVVGAVVYLGKAFVSVAEETLGTIVLLSQKAFGLVEKTFLAFDGEHSGSHLAEYRRLVAATRSYLQHLHAGFELEQLTLKGHG